jgi:hypothetical protein
VYASAAVLAALLHTEAVAGPVTVTTGRLVTVTVVLLVDTARLSCPQLLYWEAVRFTRKLAGQAPALTGVQRAWYVSGK